MDIQMKKGFRSGSLLEIVEDCVLPNVLKILILTPYAIFKENLNFLPKSFVFSKISSTIGHKKM